MSTTTPPAALAPGVEPPPVTKCIRCGAINPEAFSIKPHGSVVAIVFCCAGCKAKAIQWVRETLQLALAQCEAVEQSHDIDTL